MGWEAQKDHSYSLWVLRTVQMEEKVPWSLYVADACILFPVGDVLELNVSVEARSLTRYWTIG